MLVPLAGPVIDARESVSRLTGDATRDVYEFQGDKSLKSTEKERGGPEEGMERAMRARMRCALGYLVVVDLALGRVYTTAITFKAHRELCWFSNLDLMRCTFLLGIPISSLLSY